MNSFPFAWRALRQDLRLGEVRILLLALIIAVASLSAVGFFTSRIQAGMGQQAADLLGADLVLMSNEEFPETLRQRAQQAGLQSANILSFRSMVTADNGGDLSLTEIKAVSPEYPLRGALRVSDGDIRADQVANGLPPAGSVWVEPRLLLQLGIQVGDKLQVGLKPMRVDKILTEEPDRGGFFQLAPRVLLNIADLQDSGLLGPGSRVRHQLLLAGDATQSFRAQIEDEAKKQGWELRGVEDSRPELRQALEQSQRFLNLAALVAVLVAGAAVAIAAQRYAERQANAAAVMRCLGASQAFLQRVYVWRMLLLGSLASLIGLSLGFVLQAGISVLLADFFAYELPAPQLWPIVLGFATGFLSLFSFAFPAVLRIRQVPPLRVLRQDLGAPPPAVWRFALLSFAGMAALLYWQAGEARLALFMLGGLLLTLAVLTGVALLLLRLLKPLRQRAGGGWRFGLANLSRRASSSAIQLAGFGVGMMALLLLAVVRVDILSAWQTKTPDDAPNHFLINIQPQDVAQVQARLAEKNYPATLYPMLPGKWLSLNDQAVDPEAYENPRAQRLARRAFNLSWMETLPAHNKLVAGEWWTGEKQASVEKGIAETLGIKIGDQLRFSLAGVEVEAKVVNLREVSWDSFQVNFFVSFSPDVLRELPATYLTSFYLPPGEDAFLLQLIRDFPSITDFNVDALIGQVKGIMNRAVLAVEYVFALTLLAGLLVLYAAIQASREERLHEGAILRALGARRTQILTALMAEFVTLGALAGFLAATMAGMMGYVLATQVFDLPYHLNPWLWLIGVGGGALGVGAAGLLGTYHLLRRPPSETLRLVL